MSVITCRSNQLRGTGEFSWDRPDQSFYNYAGGSSGAWQVTDSSTQCGEPLASVTHVDIVHGRHSQIPLGTQWILCGQVRNTRYVSREDLKPFGQTGLPTCATLIAIRRSSEWWRLGRTIRQEIQASQSASLPRRLRSLSSMIRRWQFGRDLSEQFDCVTWFEYEPRDAASCDELIALWRASDEWKFVERECDLHMIRA